MIIISAYAQATLPPFNMIGHFSHTYKIKLMFALKAIPNTLWDKHDVLMSYTQEDLSQPGVVDLRQTSCLGVIILDQECLIFIQNNPKLLL